MSEVILNAAGIEEALDSMAQTLMKREGDAPFAVVGIRRGGENLAKRLAAKLHANQAGGDEPGMVDISLYRDDGFDPSDWPTVGVTSIPFELKQYTVVLVDDVLYTGRTVRAALDVLLDYGRPKAVRLAVLVDRGLRELPVAADAAGKKLETTHDDHIDVFAGPAPSDEDRVEMRSRKR